MPALKLFLGLAAAFVAAGAGIGTIYPKQSSVVSDATDGAAATGAYCYDGQSLWKHAQTAAHRVPKSSWEHIGSPPDCSASGGTPFLTKEPIGIMIIGGTKDVVYAATIRGDDNRRIKVLTDDFSRDKQ